jgi:serine phosphatase RsbU (regulator of sigma subunit)
MFSVLALSCLAPFVAFWPYSKLKGQVRLTAVLCACWGLLDCVFLAQQVVRGRESWLSSVEDFVSCAVAGVVLWIVVLTLRKHRASTLERATMRGEMAAAGQIQRMLVPERLEVAAGIEVSAAFFPAKDVGGDFYFCRMLAAGTQRILLGDVSGKGVPAALTSALLLGAADRCDHLRPSEVLSEMNQVLWRKAMTGFTTCLCADLTPDGSLTLANAGHIAPYRNGEEMSIEPGLPLGITSDAVYPETAVQLSPGDALTFLSDGVVEARAPGGELFGFERTREISARSAEEIAAVAQQFGQEDEITVLRLTFEPAGVLVL